mmetsp:Transcript_44174/g.126057  ORF Transcript_44174/g.126057 Transcript_44174/m.126057 type:complete len:231 (-) Transcript_44174:1552-2244(-)
MADGSAEAASLQDVVHTIQGQHLEGLEDNVLAVVDPEAGLLRPGKAADVERVMAAREAPVLHHRLQLRAGVLAPADVVQGGGAEEVALDEVGAPEADAAEEHAVNLRRGAAARSLRLPAPPHALGLLLGDAAGRQAPTVPRLTHDLAPELAVGPADGGADPAGHPCPGGVDFAPFRLTRVAVGLLRHVRQIHTQPVHVALVPRVRITAELAVGPAKGRAEPLAPRLGALL